MNGGVSWVYAHFSKKGLKKTLGFADVPKIKILDEYCSAPQESIEYSITTVPENRAAQPKMLIHSGFLRMFP